jgi:hypothetical protein
MNRAGDPAVPIISKACVLIGKRYSGKTTIHYAASVTAAEPNNNVDDGTRECETSRFRVGDTNYCVVDTVGFRGDAAADYAVLDKIKKELKRIGNLSCIFIVISLRRFEASDVRVIDFVCSNFTQVVRDSAWLIITNCCNEDRQEAIDTLITPTRYGKISTFEGRILNYDLPRFRIRAGEEAMQPILQGRYESARDEIRKTIVNSQVEFNHDELFVPSYCTIM